MTIYIIYWYIVSRHNIKYRYQMKSKLIKEKKIEWWYGKHAQRQHAWNNVEWKQIQIGAVQQKLPYKQGVNITLEHMHKKASGQCSATLVSKWCFKRRSSSKRKILLEAGTWKYFQMRYLASVWQDHPHPQCILKLLWGRGCDKIVYWRNNIFMVPSGGGGKKFIKEVTRLFNLWTEDWSLEDIVLKAIHVMPTLLLQMPNKNSKTKHHVVALEMRLELWEMEILSNY